MTGVGLGWLAPSLYQLKNSPETSFTSEQCAWIASAHYITRAFSPFLTILALDRLGRNVTLILSAFIAFIMWIAVYYSQLVYVHYAVRLLFGISVGFCEAASSIYIGENCSSKLRGIFNGLCTSFFYFGELADFVLAAYLSYEWVAVANCLLGLVTISSTFLLKEPAQYLIMKGNLAKAERNYDYLHDLQKSKMKTEFEDIKQYVDEVRHRKFSLQTFRSREVLKSLRLVLITNFLSLAGGFTAINSFVTIVLVDSESLSTSELTVLIGIAQFLSISFLSPFMDVFNRRTLFLLSSALIAITHATTAALYYVSLFHEVPYFNWLVFTLLTIFLCLDGMFMGPLTAVITGELLPQDVRGMGSSLAVVFGSLGGFLGAKIFLPINDSFGIHVNFILFAIVNLTMLFYVYFDLPETKGKTLVDIQRELKGDNSQEAIQMNVENTRL